MSETDAIDVIGEGAVSGNQASIPANVRRQADIEDGDVLRWSWDAGELSVQVVRRRSGVFDGFEGFAGRSSRLDIDQAGVEPAGDRDAGEPEA